jgi:hypothetical protein
MCGDALSLRRRCPSDHRDELAFNARKLGLLH